MEGSPGTECTEPCHSAPMFSSKVLRTSITIMSPKDAQWDQFLTLLETQQ